MWCVLVQTSVVAVLNKAAHRGEGDIDADYMRTRIHGAAVLPYSSTPVMPPKT